MVWCGKERFGRVRWYGRGVLKTKDWSSEWDECGVRRDGSRDEGQEREDEEHSKVFYTTIIIIINMDLISQI